jgi:uncharacterized protein YeaO (DUF488 family)
MPAIRTKCVWDSFDPREDGLRILATRYIPRGCPKKNYDIWMANLGPGEHLLKSFLGNKIAWAEFSKRYKAEQLGSDTKEPGNPRIRNCGQKFTLRLLKHLAGEQQLTFLCNCASDESQCHRHLLKGLLEAASV